MDHWDRSEAAGKFRGRNYGTVSVQSWLELNHSVVSVVQVAAGKQASSVAGAPARYIQVQSWQGLTTVLYVESQQGLLVSSVAENTAGLTGMAHIRLGRRGE